MFRFQYLQCKKNQLSQSLSQKHISERAFFLALLALSFRNEVKIGELTQFSQPLHSKQANYSVFMQAATIWQTLAIDGYCWIALRFNKSGFNYSLHHAVLKLAYSAVAILYSN
jgi:hypothetical protein